MRKSPSQQRSRLMVDTILEAATRVLTQRGWAGFKTSEVAEVAGISIGSLYQYFPDKLSLAEQILQRHLQGVLAALAAADADSPGRSLAQQVSKLIEGVIAVHSVNQDLHRVLLEDVPLDIGKRYADFETAYLARYRTLVARHASAADALRTDIAARVLAAAVEGVVHNAARYGELESPLLKQELELMLIAYLRSRRQLSTEKLPRKQTLRASQN